jgi:hypothetical protein
MKAHRERVAAKMNVCLETMKANQEKTEVAVEHYKRAPCVKSIKLLTILQGWTMQVPE